LYFCLLAGVLRRLRSFPTRRSSDLLLWIRRVVWPLGLPAGRVLRRWSVRRHRPGGGAQHRLVGVEVRAWAGDGAVGGAAELVVVDGDVGQRGAAGVGDGVGPGDRGAADHAGPVLECGGVDIADAGPVTGLRTVPGLFVDADARDRKSTRLNSSHVSISYAVFCLKKKKNNTNELDA